MPTLPQENRFHTYTYWLLIAAGVYTLLPFLILSFYNHPQADDFSFAKRDTTLSFFAAQAEYYMHWSGRYFGTAIVRLSPLTFDSFAAYKLYAFILLMLFCGALYFTLLTVTKVAFSKTKVLALAALLFTLYLLQLPSPSEGFYFFSTCATYQLPTIMLLVLLAILFKFFQTQSSLAKKVYIGLAAILCVAMVGSNEMALVITFTTILLVTLLNLRNKEDRPYLLFLFIVCVICCLVAVLAPGNFNRMNEHPNGGKLVWSVVYAGFMTGLSFYRWLLPILAASIVYIYYFGIPLAEKSTYNRLFKADIRLVALYFLVTIFLMNFVFAWSTGERPTPRLENVIYFFFLFGWFYMLQVAIYKYKTAFSSASSVPFVIPSFAALIFILSVLHIENNISTAYTDLISGKAAAYSNALNQRYTLLNNSDCTTCVVAPLPAIPKTIYFADIISRSEKPENGIDMMWVNKGFAAYWNKEAVYLAAPNPPLQDNLTTLRQTGKSTLQKRSEKKIKNILRGLQPFNTFRDSCL